MFKKVAAIVLLPALLGVAVMTVYLMHSFLNSFLSLTADTVESAAEFDWLPQIAEEEDMESSTFLIYGLDAGEWVGGTYREGLARADTIVLFKVFPSQVKASMLSIPRDTLVEIPGRSGVDKINHAYAFGQADLLVETVELFSGVAVDYYIGLNYPAFKDIVDILGGVEFDVDRVIQARGLRLEEGLQVLDGDQAFALVSFRMESLGDIARVMRQQRFIWAVAREARGSPLDQLIFVLAAAWNNIETNLEPSEMVALGRKFRGIKEENITAEMVPGWFYNRSGISYWKPYVNQLDQIVDTLFNVN